MVIAITGGIGSGKSHVCRMLEQRGINVYDCDAAAKRLMRTSETLRQQLKALVGDDVYTATHDNQQSAMPDGQPATRLNKAVMARFLLQSEDHAQAIDDIVHPAVAADFLSSGQEWIESAILFESRFDRRIRPDYVVCVSAPLETRIQRVMQRDHISREKTLEWIARQLPQEEVIRRSHYEIVNDGIRPLGTQIDDLLHQLRTTENNK